MTATDELRRMLDERDEYYKTSGNRTWWGRPTDARTGEPINVFHNQAQPMGEDRLFVELQLATPEQAIAATLGRGTCEPVDGYDDDGEEIGTCCSECGSPWPVYYVVRYCPVCGCKVVDDASVD